jgi:hypothetical protein
MTEEIIIEIEEKGNGCNNGYKSEIVQTLVREYKGLTREYASKIVETGKFDELKRYQKRNWGY